jgi:hypothetical protein
MKIKKKMKKEGGREGERAEEKTTGRDASPQLQVAPHSTAPSARCSPP